MKKIYDINGKIVLILRVTVVVKKSVRKRRQHQLTKTTSLALKYRVAHIRDKPHASHKLELALILHVQQVNDGLIDVLFRDQQFFYQIK